MANFYNYTGIGGINNGTQFPPGGTVQVGETLVAMTPLPDNREGVQGGVLIQCFANLSTISGASVGTIICRQSTLGSSAITGAAVGTEYVALSGTQIVVSATFVDQSGTFPIPAYQFTLNSSTGTGTILKSYIIATPIGQ